MRNIKLTVAYDGTAYHGFQDQGKDLPTIQGMLEASVRRLSGERLRIMAAGRTDAGVHALGQVVNLRTTSGIPVERWPYAMNSVLPPDIVVSAAEVVPDLFHSRYWAVEKTYRYTIDNGRFPQVFQRRYAYYVPQQLDMEAMAKAAKVLVGTHDFRAFRAAGSSVQSNVRTLLEAAVERSGDTVRVTLTGDGFLYNMVRIVVGTLLEIGLGRQSPGWMDTVLDSGDRSLGGPTVPPHGLCLVRVAHKADDVLDIIPNGGIE